ncbi:MAG TPA: hypothetical protein VGE72_26130 [Azospirillum sp.]
MTLPAECRLPFLGTRPYLQGTTVFEAVRAHAPGAVALDYQIAHMVFSDRLRVVDLPSSGLAVRDVNGYLRATLADGGEVFLGIVALPASPAPERIPFDEDEITDPAVFAAGRVDAPWCRRHGIVTNLVSIKKALLQREIAHTRPGKWLFTRLELSAPLPEAAERLAVRREKALVGGTMIRSVILADDVPLGHMYFNWKQVIPPAA